MISIRSISKSFGPQKVLNGINLEIGDSERLIILGQNGAGKTTLLRCLLGHYRLDAGSILINGFNPRAERKKALMEVAFIPQLPPPLPFTIRALLEYVQKTSGCSVSEIHRFSRCFDLDLEKESNKAFSKLSGGMKQKVLASIAFARHAPIMFFDEPTANLDVEARKAFGKIIRSPEFEKTGMLFISHRIDELDTVLNRAIYLDFGKVVKDEQLL